jgi:hypothetical protein
MRARIVRIPCLCKHTRATQKGTKIQGVFSSPMISKKKLGPQESYLWDVRVQWNILHGLRAVMYMRVET